MHPIDRHENVVLQFSGGKDSIACLELFRPYWDRITVLWLNTGDPLPELLEQIEKVKTAVPKFVEVTTDSRSYAEHYGHPVDVLPIRNHWEAQHLAGLQRMRLQSFLACCADNIMLPMHRKTAELGATLIIRGQKLSDAHKSPVRSGDIIDGVEYYFPLEGWTDAQVFETIRGSDFLPPNYTEGNPSLECWHCTAYAQDHKARRAYLERFHPEKAAEVKRRVILIKQEIMADLQHME